MLSLKTFDKKMLLGLTLGALLLISIPVQADTVNVDITIFTFVPDSVRILVGETVRWINHDTDMHTSTSDNGVWDSGNLATGEQFSFTFDSTGVYPYHCEIHPSMTGKIVVHEPVPALTPYGFGIIILLLIANTIWVLRKRKAAAVRR